MALFQGWRGKWHNILFTTLFHSRDIFISPAQYFVFSSSWISIQHLSYCMWVTDIFPQWCYFRYLAAETRDCSIGGIESATVSGSTWYAQYARTFAVGLYLPGEVLQLPWLLLLSLLHVEDFHSKPNLNPNNHTSKNWVKMRIFAFFYDGSLVCL